MTALVLDLFAGPGGWDVGHRLAVPDGSEETRGIEWDRTACETAKAAGFVRMCADVSKVNPTALGVFVGQVASPPCQGFSAAGRGAGRADAEELMAAARTMGMDTRPERLAEVIRQLHCAMVDDRSVLALEPLRYALAMLHAGRPFQWMAWEQVPAVLPLWEVCAQVLRDHGYAAEAQMVHAEQHGVPQTRKRAVMRATLDPAGLRPLVPTHSRFHTRTPSRLDPGVARWVTMSEALGWTGLVGFPRRADSDAEGTVVELGGVEYRARDLADPEERPSVVVTEKARSWSRWALGDIRSSHGTIRQGDHPAPTLTASLDNGNTQVIHDGAANGHRVTIREASALQSFPMDYPWRGTRTQQFRQVGDAVPPLLAKAIIESVRWTP